MKFREQEREQLIDTLCRQEIVRHNRDIAEHLSSKIEQIVVKENDPLFKQDDENDDLFFILSGTFKITVNGNEVARYGSNEHVGELLAIDTNIRRRKASAIALEDSLVARLFARDLNEIGEKYPLIYLHFAQDLAKRLAATNERIKKQINSVFISHGRSEAWAQVQRYIEKDLKLDTVELCQEPSHGQTIIEKLVDNAARCNCAVCVMTGDDISNEEIRVRENVMHEIGFFQGSYGLNRVILLYEGGVNIPTNLSGIIYIKFAKGDIRSSFYLLQQELNAIYNLQNNPIF